MPFNRSKCFVILFLFCALLNNRAFSATDAQTAQLRKTGAVTSGFFTPKLCEGATPYNRDYGFSMSIDFDGVSVPDMIYLGDGSAGSGFIPLLTLNFIGTFPGNLELKFRLFPPSTVPYSGWKYYVTNYGLQLKWSYLDFIAKTPAVPMAILVSFSSGNLNTSKSGRIPYTTGSTAFTLVNLFSYPIGDMWEPYLGVGFMRATTNTTGRTQSALNGWNNDIGIFFSTGVNLKWTNVNWSVEYSNILENSSVSSSVEFRIL